MDSLIKGKSSIDDLDKIGSDKKIDSLIKDKKGSAFDDLTNLEKNTPKTKKVKSKKLDDLKEL